MLFTHEKTWRLRKALTDKRKALIGARSHPTGLSRLMIEALESEIAAIQAEIKQRAPAPGAKGR